VRDGEAAGGTASRPPGLPVIGSPERDCPRTTAGAWARPRPERRVWVVADGLPMSGAVPRTGTCAAYTTAKATIFIYQQHSAPGPPRSRRDYADDKACGPPPDRTTRVAGRLVSCSDASSTGAPGAPAGARGVACYGTLSALASSTQIRLIDNHLGVRASVLASTDPMGWVHEPSAEPLFWLANEVPARRV
jgi:hypothetical protein